MQYNFELPFKVRDYECDLQGVVNNAVYQNYLEHTRHEFISSMGLDFAKLHDDGIDAMVIKIELEYKMPLRSGDEFIVKTATEREGSLKYIFLQDVYRKSDDKLMLKGKVTAVCVNAKSGRPMVCAQLSEVFDVCIKVTSN
jgi:acyl-CoA thioester hydrolase